MDMLALFFLVSVAIGGVAWVFIYPILSGEKKAERRQEAVTRSAEGARAGIAAARTTQRSRREQVEGTLKQIEGRHSTAKSVPLAVKITQAGLTWSKRRYMITAGVLGIVAALLCL